MNNTTYNANRWVDMQSYAVATSAMGVTGSAAAGATTNLNLQLPGDMFFRGVQVILSGATFGDTISLQIVDTNGVTGAPPGTVISTPVSNWNVVSDDQSAISYEAVVPKKIPGSFTLRVAYTSTGLLTPVSVAVNYELLAILL